jgi:hypothetical protein
MWRVTLLMSASAMSIEGQDTVRVRADGAPKWGSPVRLVQEVAIGAVDGPPEYAFGQIELAAMEPGGGFYLYDRNDRQIRRYDRGGRFLNVVGKSGNGPGEYAWMAAMAVTRDGRLIVHDAENSRITYFDPSGTVAREFRLIRRSIYVENFIVDTLGRIYLTVRLPGTRAPGSTAGEQYLRLTPDGAVIDSLPRPELRLDMTGPGRAFFLNTSEGARWNFVELPLLAFYPPGGYLLGSSHAFRFIVSRPGEPVLVVERSYTPISLGTEERAEWLESAAWLEANRPGGFKYVIARTKPPVRALMGDHLGRIWVELFGPAEKRNDPPRSPGNNRPQLTWKERTTYDVFSPTGDYLGHVALPAESMLLGVRDDRILTRGKGPDGEDRVLVFRMELGEGRRVR